MPVLSIYHNLQLLPCQGGELNQNVISKRQQQHTHTGPVYSFTTVRLNFSAAGEETHEEMMSDSILVAALSSPLT